MNSKREEESFEDKIIEEYVGVALDSLPSWLDKEGDVVKALFHAQARALAYILKKREVEKIISDAVRDALDPEKCK